MAEKCVFEKDNLLVHVNYGIGQVTALENKCLGNKHILYYRIEGENYTFWLPVNNADTKRVRPAVSRKEMQKSIHTLEGRPKALGKNHKQRQDRIKDAVSKCSIVPTARLVRDLLVAQAERKLGESELKALDKLEKHFIMEWSVVYNFKLQKARMELRELLTIDD